MKICFWISSLFTLGGTKRVVTLLANELSKSHEIVVLSYDKPDAQDRSLYGLSDSVTVDYKERHQFRKTGLWNRIYHKALLFIAERTRLLDHRLFGTLLREAYYPRTEYQQWIRYFNDCHFDIIIGIAEHAMPLAIMSGSLACGTVGWVHSTYEAYTQNRFQLFWHKEKLMKDYFPKLGRLVVLNSYIQKRYNDMIGVWPTVIGNPLSFLCEEKSKGNHDRFFAAARLVPEKGLDLLLQAFAGYVFRCREEHKAIWELVIAGEGPEKDRLQTLAEQLQICDKVRFAGLVKDIRDYYLDSDIYLMTSRYEGFGLVVIEAFEAGIPVIAFDIEPMRQMIEAGKDGILVPQFDVDTFSERMYELAGDPEQRKQMGQYASCKVKMYSLETITEEWESLLSEIREAGRFGKTE